MCRTGGRRCEQKWDDAHRERYNARRRIARNSAKAAAARQAGDEAKAEMYDDLTLSARDAADHYTHLIESHEAESELGGSGEPVVMRDARGMSTQITPGELDDNARHLYMNGQCVAMATALAEQRGWGVAVHTYGEEGLVKHAYAVDDKGGYWDVRGEHDPEAIEEELDEDEQVEHYRSSEIEYVKDDTEGKIGQQDLDLARSVAPAVLREHEPQISDEEHDEALSDLRSRLDESRGPDGAVGAQRCPNCGQFAADSHDCPETLKDSVVRDEDGGLLTVHHGSSVDFETFDPAFTGTGNDSWGSGFYFTDDESRAHGYGEHVKNVHLNITNPIVVDGLENPHLDNTMYFSAEQSAQILRHHPDIYNQPGDEDNPNPLEDYSPEFWDKEEWTREEMDQMIDKVSKEYYDDVPWSNLESTFPGEKSDAFRRGVQEATGHDGVVSDFGDEGKHYIAWFPEQIQEAAPEPSTSSGTSERCDRCGQYAGSGHSCPGPREDELRQWRESLTDAEREAWDDYGSISHADLNEQLRDVKGATAYLSDEEKQTVAGMDSALARAPRAEDTYTVHRGIRTETTTGKGLDGREWVKQNTPVGETVTFHSYTSTTLDPAQAEYFSGANSEYGASGVIFEIETSQGGNWGSEGPEAEVTLARGSRFEVVSVDEDHTVNDRPYPKVHLREVTDNPPSRPAWSDGEYTSPKSGETYYTVTEEKAVTMRTKEGALVGSVTWGDNSVIGNVQVRGQYQRQGVATEMLRRAREVNPQIEHSDRLSNDAQAWIKGMESSQSPRHPLAVQDSEPMEFAYVRNPVSSTEHLPAGDTTYGQDIEPSGRYMSESSGFAPDGWESGTVRFEQPLHLDYGDSTRDWKERLSNHYGGKTGKALSQAVRDDGYDAIVTRDKYGTSETIDLTSFDQSDHS